MWILAAAALAQEAPVHHRFHDVPRWVSVFDDPARDEWQKPGPLVAELGISPGQTVADIGAGTGYLEPWLAAAVGEEGRVVAIDVEATLVAHMARRFAVDQKLPQVEVRLGALQDPHLWGREADWVILLDTYHHIDDRVAYFTRLRDGVARKGRLVVVDFRADLDGPPGPPRAHRLAPEVVEAELREARWRLDRRIEGLLPHQYVLVFVR